MNALNDLSNLAKNHDLEGQLYEGAGLEKVFSLLSYDISDQKTSPLNSGRK